MLAALLVCTPRQVRAGETDGAVPTDAKPADVTAVAAGGVAADFPPGVVDQAGGDASGAAVGETGMASFYGRAHQGKRTASGSRFNQLAMTAAHPWLPLGTKVLVTVQRTGRAVVVTITDRLPSGRRIIDVSLGAARKLGFVGQGLAEVSLAQIGFSTR